MGGGSSKMTIAPQKGPHKISTRILNEYVEQVSLYPELLVLHLFPVRVTANHIRMRRRKYEIDWSIANAV